MESVLVDVPPDHCVVYLADLLTYRKDFRGALTSLRALFMAIRRANLAARNWVFVAHYQLGGNFNGS